MLKHTNENNSINLTGEVSLELMAKIDSQLMTWTVKDSILTQNPDKSNIMATFQPKGVMQSLVVQNPNG